MALSRHLAVVLRGGGYHIYIYIYIYMVTPPPMTDRAQTSLPPACSCFSRGIEFEPSERVREEPPDHRNQKTKKPKLHGECWNSFGFLVFWFFVFLVFWFFGFLLYWLFGFIVERVIFQTNPKNQKTKEPKNQKTKEPKNQKTKKPKKQKTKEPKNQITKKPKKQNCSSILRGALVFWFFGFGRRVVLHGHVRRVQTRYPGKRRSILILILS